MRALIIKNTCFMTRAFIIQKENVSHADNSCHKNMSSFFYWKFLSFAKGGGGGGSEGFVKSMTLFLTLKWPYLDKDGLPEALDRCIRILPPRRIFLAILRKSLDIVGLNRVCTAIAPYIGSAPRNRPNQGSETKSWTWRGGGGGVQGVIQNLHQNR